MIPGKLYEVYFDPKYYYESKFTFAIAVGNKFIDYPAGSHFLCVDYHLGDDNWVTANVLMQDGIKGELLYMTDTHLDRAIKPLEKQKQMTVEELKRKFREARNFVAAVTVTPILFGGLVSYVSALLLYTFLKDDQQTLKCHHCHKAFDYEYISGYHDTNSKTLFVYCPHCYTKNVYHNLNNEYT